MVEKYHTKQPIGRKRPVLPLSIYGFKIKISLARILHLTLLKESQIKSEIEMYSGNLKRIIEHKIYMALVLNEKRAGLILDTEDCLGYKRDAVIIAEKIEAEYESKNGAGAIWLAGLIKNDKILDIL